MGSWCGGAVLGFFCASLPAPRYRFFLLISSEQLSGTRVLSALGMDGARTGGGQGACGTETEMGSLASVRSSFRLPGAFFFILFYFLLNYVWIVFV